MASTIVTGPHPADADPHADAAAKSDTTAEPDPSSEPGATGHPDATPLDWSGDGDDFEPPDDRISAFFGPVHSRTNRVALAVVAGVFVVALVAALVAGLTGGSAGGPNRAAATTHRPLVPSQALGAAALLTVSDFPSGWAGAGTAAVTHGPAWSARLASCVGVPAAVAHATPSKVSSPVFTSSDKTAALEESVSVYPTAAQALAEYKAIASAKTPGCINSVGSAALRASIQAEAGSAASVGKVAITPIPSGTLPAHETGIRVAIPLSTNAGQLTINSTEVDFVKGRLFEQLNFNGNGAPFPALLEVQLIDAAMHRASS